MSWIAIYVNNPLAYQKWLKDRKGIEVYVPISRHLTKPRGKKQPITIERAAFNNYVFVELNPIRPIWGAIREAPGYFYVVSQNGFPSEIPQQSIDHIRSLQEKGMFDRIGVDFKLVFRKGVGVEITMGPLEGKRGEIILPPRKADGHAKIQMENGIAKIPLSNIRILGHSRERTSLDDPAAPASEQRSSPRGRRFKPQSST